MTSVKDNTGLLKIFEDKFEAFASTLNGGASSQLHEKRKQAFELLNVQGFPGKKHEEYKYTPITKILEKDLEDAKSVEQTEQTDLLNLFSGNDDIQLLVLRNGVYDESSSSSIEQEGLKLMKISDASDLEDATFLKNFNNAIPGENDSFTLLNTSFSQEGFFLHISKNFSINKPIVLLHLNDGDCIRIVNPRNLLVFEEGSEATFIECFQTSGQWPVFSNSLSEFIVGANARVNYSRLGADGDNSIRVSTTQVVQENDSRFTSTAMDFGGKTIRNNININVEGTGCESNMNGVYLLKGTSHVDNHTMIDHKKPHCESNEVYKGIIGDSARGVFNGKIYVRKEAQKTNAFQQNNNILLSDDAIVNTKPQLEIWADDVKCSHGCTSGQIDNEQIFYLRSRGIDENVARKMLIHAYASEVLETLDLDILKEFSENRISEMLVDM
jgi:Fe-S cluster assembly protein SufD